MTIKHGSSVLMTEGNYPTGGNLSITTVSTVGDGNKFVVTRASGIFDGATHVVIEYDTPGDGEASASWNPFQTGNEHEALNGTAVPGNRRFRRMTIHGMPLHTAYFRNSDLKTASTLEGNSDGPGQYVSKSLALSTQHGSLLSGQNVYFRGMTGQSTSDEEDHDHAHENTNWEAISLDLGNGDVVFAEANYNADSLLEGAEGTRVFDVTSSAGKLAGGSQIIVSHQSTFSKIQVRS